MQTTAYTFLTPEPIGNPIEPIMKAELLRLKSWMILNWAGGLILKMLC